MNEDENNRPTTTSTSRRTGIDRRWIPSSDYQPERRRGMDRRSIRNQSLAVLPDLSDAEGNRERFLEIGGGKKNREEKNAVLPFDLKGFSPLPETILKRESSGEH